MEIQDHDIVAREYRPGQYRLELKKDGCLVTIDPGPYTQVQADQIAVGMAGDGNVAAFRLQLNGHLELLEGV